jgi:large subunit ribosomal protein L25
MSDDTFHIELEARTVTGKAVKQLRNSGHIPAVIHDHGKGSINVQAPYTIMHHVYQKAGKHHPVHLTAGAKTYTALIKSATFDPKKNLLTHIVFNAVTKNQKVEAEVPVRPRYAEGNDSSPAERASLLVLTQLDAVTVRAIADKIPDVMEYDAELLVEVGDQITVAQLVIPVGVEILDEAEHPIATVFEPSAVEAANAESGNPEHEMAAAESTASGSIEEATTEKVA